MNDRLGAEDDDRVPVVGASMPLTEGHASTAHRALQAGEALLTRAGSEEASSDAAVLLAHVLCSDRAALWAHPERCLSAAELALYERLLGRRAVGEPTAYLTGVREFWSLPFRVDPRVLIPRPETEHLVEVVLALCTQPDPLILDVGTGSGCIALALLSERPGAWALGIDISIDALSVAGDNARHLGLQNRFRLVRGRGLDALAVGVADVVVSNPPYIRRADLAALPVTVREHEPSEALICEQDGLSVTWQVIEAAVRVLVAGGLLVLEIDPVQAEAVAARLGQRAWQDIGMQRDLAGRPRVVHAVRTGGQDGSVSTR